MRLSYRTDGCYDYGTECLGEVYADMSKTLGMIGCLVSLLLTVLVSTAGIGRAETHASPLAPTTTPQEAAPTANYIGSTLCKACHATVYDPWATSPHGQALTQADLPEKLRGCEACHGPGSLHVGYRTKYKPVIPTAADADKTNALCGSCHFQQTPSLAPKEWQTLSFTNFAQSQHGRKGVSCLACHTAHPNGQAHALTQPPQALCMSCHAAVLEEAPGKKAAYTHLPVAQGQCLLCHDPHGTPDGRMLRPALGKVCQTCHTVTDAAMATAHKNYPMADTDCTTCHNPHSHDQKAALIQGKQHAPFKWGKCELCHAKAEAGKPIGLVKPAKELCLSCHPASTLMPENETAHAPVKAGLCLACHNPHVSTQKALLKNRPANLCFTCHQKVQRDTLAPHKHKILEATMNCRLCHKPHSSPQDFLLVKDQQALCGQCHKHSFSHPMVKKADGKAVINPMTNKPLVCSGCHEIHGSEFAQMTRGSKDRDLCLKCHNTDHEKP